jgi:hypothetical protein
MAKKKAAPSGASPSALMALSFAEAVALPQSDRIERFVIESLSAQRAFSAMGKLYRIIEKNLESGQSIFRLLQDAGIKKGTISNASYAAKVYDLVEQGHITETEYDSLSFNDCWQICRVQSKTSKRQLTPAEVAAVIRNASDFADDLAALYDSGMTAEEKTEAEAKIKALKEAAEAEAKLKAEAQAKELEEALKRKKELEEQLAAQATQTANPQTAEAPTPATPTSAPAPAKATATPVPSAEAPASAAPTAAPEQPATAAELIGLLEEVEQAMKALSEDDQGIVGAKLVEMAAAFAESSTVAAAK